MPHNSALSESTIDIEIENNCQSTRLQGRKCAWALFGKICGADQQDQNRRPNDRVLFNFCHIV